MYDGNPPPKPTPPTIYRFCDGCGRPDGKCVCRRLAAFVGVLLTAGALFAAFAVDSVHRAAKAPPLKVIQVDDEQLKINHLILKNIEELNEWVGHLHARLVAIEHPRQPDEAEIIPMAGPSIDGPPPGWDKQSPLDGLKSLVVKP